MHLNKLRTAIAQALQHDNFEFAPDLDKRPRSSSDDNTDEPTSIQHVVLGGDVSAHGKVGWIEQFTWPAEQGYVRVEIQVNLASKGVIQHSRDIETYNPYFGCRVYCSKWIQDHFVFVYGEKHLTIASTVSFRTGRQRLAVLQFPWGATTNAIYFRDPEWPHLLRGIAVPSQAPVVPLFVPVKTAEHFYENLHVEDSATLWVIFRPNIHASADEIGPSPFEVPLRKTSPLRHKNRCDTWLDICTTLLGSDAPEHGVHVLLESLAQPFLRDPKRVYYGYPNAAGRSWAPHADRWICVYYYRYLLSTHQSELAAQWLRWLERLSKNADSTPGWPADRSDDDAIASMVASCIKYGAAELVEACHSGVLPRHSDGYAAVSKTEPKALEGFRIVRETLRSAKVEALPSKKDWLAISVLTVPKEFKNGPLPP